MPSHDDDQTVAAHIDQHGPQCIDDAAGGDQMLPDRQSRQSKTVSTKPDTGVQHALPEAQEDGSRLSAPNDQRWIETVLASLKGRSHKAKQALQQALLDGHRLNPAGLTTIVPRLHFCAAGQADRLAGMGAGGNIPAWHDSSLAAIRQAFGCDETLAETIAALSRETALARGAVLWPRGESSDSTLIVTGLAQEVAYGRDGGMLILHRLGPGDLFGDLLDEGPESGTRIEGVANGQGALFASAVIVRLIDSYSCVGLAISRQLARRLAALRHRMVETALLSVTGRICAELLRRSAGMPDRTIRPMPVMSELATSVGTTRETVSRTVSQLEKRGVVRRIAGGLAIVAPHRLEEQAY